MEGEARFLSEKEIEMWIREAFETDKRLPSNGLKPASAKAWWPDIPRGIKKSLGWQANGTADDYDGYDYIHTQEHDTPRVIASREQIKAMDEAFEYLTWVYKLNGFHNLERVPNKWKGFVSYMMGVPASMVADKCKCSRRTVYYWRDEYIGTIARRVNGLRA